MQKRDILESPCRKPMGAGLTTFDAVLAIAELARISPITARPVFKPSVDPIGVVEQFGREGRKKRLS